MTNTVENVDWAVKQGANAVEADLKFDDASVGWYFQHNTETDISCDCTCYIWGAFAGETHLCDNGHFGAPCTQWTKATTLLNHMASKEELAMVFIDPKVPTFANYYETKQAKVDLGTMLGRRIVKDLFEHGNKKYRGIAVVGGYSMIDIDFLEAVAAHVDSTEFKDRVYYTIGMERRYDVTTVSKALAKISDYTFFADGLTACAPGDWTHEIKVGKAEYDKGTLAMPPLIWTVDKVSSMKDYLDAGARSLLTNSPKAALEAVEAKGLTHLLAKPGYRPGKARCR